MIKRILAGAGVLLALAVASPAYATTGSTVHVTNSPDDSVGGVPWARDTFTRTTTVTPTTGGFKVVFDDAGTFTTTVGAVTGSLKGHGEFVVTGGTAKSSLPSGTIDRASVAVKDSFTSQWWTRFVDGGQTPGITAWTWTYATACEKRVETEAGAQGDRPSKACPKPSKTTDNPNAAKPCEAYWYAGGRVNLCDRFPGADTHVTCEQVGYRVTLRDRKVDPWGLDGSGGGSRGTVGVGCESKPLRPQPSQSASSSSAAAAVPGGPALPVTGPSVWALAGAGGAVLLAGAVSLLLVRRRRTRWQA